MLQAHFAAKFAAIKERALILESASIPYLDMLRIKNLLKACEYRNETHTYQAKVSFLHELTDLINTIELRLLHEAVTT
jgi:hypothetical protein